MYSGHYSPKYEIPGQASSVYSLWTQRYVNQWNLSEKTLNNCSSSWHPSQLPDKNCSQWRSVKEVKMAEGSGSSPSLNIHSKRPKVTKDQVVQGDGVAVQEPTPPVFIRKLRKAAVGTGCDIRLRVSVAGFPKPSLTWYRNDEVLPPSEAQDSGGLWIRDCRTSDAGLYTCMATNELGDASCSAVLAIMDLGEGNHTQLKQTFFSTKT